MGIIDQIVQSVEEFKAEPPKNIEKQTDQHDFVIAEYLHRVKQDAETAEYLLRHPQNRTTN